MGGCYKIEVSINKNLQDEGKSKGGGRCTVCNLSLRSCSASTHGILPLHAIAVEPMWSACLSKKDGSINERGAGVCEVHTRVL